METFKSFNHGELPTYEEFRVAWDRQLEAGELKDGLFHIGNCKRVGTRTFTCEQLYKELQDAINDYFDSLNENESLKDKEEHNSNYEFEESTIDWASCVLYVCGFEWV